MIGYVLGIVTFTYEEDSNDEIYRCHNHSLYEIFWSETDLNSRIYSLQKRDGLKGIKYDGIELTLSTVEIITTRRLPDIDYVYQTGDLYYEQY